MTHNTDTTPTKVNKDSKLGTIPDGWMTPKINEVFQFINTTSFSRNQLNYDADNKLFYIHYGDIHATYKKPLLDFEIETNIPRLNSEVELPNSVQYLQDGDVIIADASEDYEGVGEAIEIKNLNGKAAISGLHTFALRDIDNKTVAGFRTYIFKNPNVKKALKTIATGSKVYGISKGNIQKFKIVLPPIPEQKKIAKILTTWDVAINMQEALIVQKQEQKKGLMQQLLTGKKRFDGFEDEWEEVRLGEIAKVTMGQSPISDSYNENEDGLWLIQGNADIKNRKSAPRIWTNQPTKTCDIGDILLTVRAPVGAVARSKHKACIGRGISSIKPYLNNNFIYYKLIWFEKRWLMFEQGSTFSAISSKDIKYLKFRVPIDLKEQQKIAEVITAADEEITALQYQLQKLKTQKKGLMQQLLTGKIRVNKN